MRSEGKEIRLTEKQERFFKIWLERYNASLKPKDIAKAAKEAGYSDSVPDSQLKAQILRSKNLQEAVKFFLIENGLDLNNLTKKHAELLEAKHPHYEGKPDNYIQLKALELAYKLHAAFPAEKHKVNIESKHDFTITIEEMRRAEERLLECVEGEIIEDEGDNRSEDASSEGSDAEPLFDD